MTVTPPHHARQLALLRRVSDGDDLVGAAAADLGMARDLVRQGFLRVVLHAAARSFIPTAAGRTLLRAHQMPAGPPRRQGPPASAAQSRVLVEQLVDAGGILRIHDPGDQLRAEYRRLIHAAKAHQLIPAGHRLLYTGRNHGDLIIYLAADTDDRTAWNRIRLSTRQQTDDPATIRTLLHRYHGCFGLDQASHHRAIAWIHALAEQARHQGHRLVLSTKADRPRLQLQIAGHRRTMTITTAATIAREALNRTADTPTAYPADVLAVVITRKQWHHHIWAEDDRSLTTQAADIIGQTCADIEHRRRVAAEQQRRVD